MKKRSIELAIATSTPSGSARFQRFREGASRISLLAGVTGAGALGLLLMSGGCVFDDAKAAQQQQAPQAPQVTVATVVQSQISDYDEFTGRVEAIERVELRPRVSGYVESMRFVEGAEVKNGDVLFVIDPRPYAAKLKGAQAELARAQSTLRQSQSERARAEKLIAARAFSQEEFDARSNGTERAAAEVQAAQAAVDSAALDLTFTQVRAPIAGVVGKAEITVGNFVNSGATRLTTLVSIDPVYVRFEGNEAAYLRQVGHTRDAQRDGTVAKEQPAWVGLANEEGHPHEGKLVFTANELDVATGTISARAKLDNHERLFTPGLFARVKLGDCSSYPAVLIRDSAIGTDQNRRYVYVVGKDNKVEYRAVEIGAMFDGLRVVKNGLQPTETIVVNGLQRVRPGAPITPEKVAMRGNAEKDEIRFADARK